RALVGATHLPRDGRSSRAHIGRGRDYYMTSPEGEQFHGVWHVKTVDEPTGFTVDDFFADAESAPAEGMPTVHMAFSFESTQDGTRMVCVSSYDSLDDLQK